MLKINSLRPASPETNPAGLSGVSVCDLRQHDETWELKVCRVKQSIYCVTRLSLLQPAFGSGTTFTTSFNQINLTKKLKWSFIGKKE